MKMRRGASAGLPFAAMLVLWASGSPALAVENTLEIYIENKSGAALYYDSSADVKDYPETIAAGGTSSVIKADKSGDGSGAHYNGHIIYANNANASDASCAVELKFTFTYNYNTNHCDDKVFSMYTTVGSCTLKQEGTCFGSGSCGCNFTVGDD